MITFYMKQRIEVQHLFYSRFFFRPEKKKIKIICTSRFYVIQCENNDNNMSQFTYFVVIEVAGNVYIKTYLITKLADAANIT